MATLETLEALIEEKFKQNDIAHDSMITQMKELNGSVKSNTAFKNKAKGGMIVIGSFGVVSAVVSLVALFKAVSG